MKSILLLLALKVRFGRGMIFVVFELETRRKMLITGARKHTVEKRCGPST